LLADVGHEVCDLYGVWGEKNMYGRKYFGVVRSTFIIDPEGKIAETFDKVKVPEHSVNVLATLDTLAAN
jgi:peroxiredoxin Q/BCP